MPSAEHTGAATSPSEAGTFLPKLHTVVKASGGAAPNPPCSLPPLTPYLVSLLLSPSLCWGCWYLAAMECRTCDPFPLTGHEWMQNDSGMGLPRQPEVSKQHAPHLPGRSQGRQQGASAPQQAERSLPQQKQASGREPFCSSCTWHSTEARMGVIDGSSTGRKS